MTITLPYRVVDWSEDSLVALNKNFYAIESYFNAMQRVIDANQSLVAEGWAVFTPFSRVSDSSFSVLNTASNQAIFYPGRPIRYKDTAAYYYGIVTAYSYGTVTLAGAPMDTSHATVLEWGNMTKVIQVPLAISGACMGTASVQLLIDKLKTRRVWYGPTAYLVQIAHRVETVDTGATQPKVNMVVNGTRICTANSNAGLPVAAAWSASGVQINPTFYDINYGETYDISTDGAGTNDNASDLTVIGTFVTA